MHYRGGLLPPLFLSLSRSSSLFHSRHLSFYLRPCMSFLLCSISYRSSLPFGGKNGWSLVHWRRITGHVVIIRHCRVMIRECARPLLYAFFLPFLPLPLKDLTEVVDGLNHRQGSRRNPPTPWQPPRRGVKGSPVRDQ